MIIYIDNTIAQYINKHPINDAHMEFFAAIALAYKRGNCIVFGDVNSVAALIGCLGAPIDGIYKIIQSKYSEYGSVAKWTCKVFVISYRDSNYHSFLPSVLDGKACYLSCNIAANLNWSMGACFVGENIIDCSFYENIAKYYTFKNKIKNVRIHFRHENGGGQDMHYILRNSITINKELVLCISDTDIGYESTGNPHYGGTYHSCYKESEKMKKEGYGDRFCFCHNQVHEVENLVPLSVMKSLGKSVCLPDGVKTLEKIANVDSGKPILYYDLKNGLKESDSTEYDHYWNYVKSKTTFGNDTRLFGRVTCNNFISKVNDYITKCNIASISVDTYLVGIWDDLGRIVFTWGCASFPVRA